MLRQWLALVVVITQRQVTQPLHLNLTVISIDGGKMGQNSHVTTIFPISKSLKKQPVALEAMNWGSLKLGTHSPYQVFRFVSFFFRFFLLVSFFWLTYLCFSILKSRRTILMWTEKVYSFDQSLKFI